MGEEEVGVLDGWVDWVSSWIRFREEGERERRVEKSRRIDRGLTRMCSFARSQSTERREEFSTQRSRRTIQSPSIQDSRKDETLPGSFSLAFLFHLSSSSLRSDSSFTHLLSNRRFSGLLKSASATPRDSSFLPSPPTNFKPSLLSSQSPTSQLFPPYFDSLDA